MAKVKNREILTRRLGVEESLLEDIYHRMIRMPWSNFFGLHATIYVGINMFFGFLYWLTPESVANIKPGDYFSCFAFSVQTFSTVGYGFFYPISAMGHFLVTAESATGLFSTALLTGLVFAKFSRPASRVVFSNHILWVKSNGRDALTLRMGNVRTNQVYEGQARLTLLRDEVSAEGEKLRRLVDLKLLRDETPLFILSWQLYHFIDETSPLYGKTIEEVQNLGWDFFVTFRGMDQDIGQAIVAHCDYPSERLIRARKFADMISVKDRVRTIDFSKMNHIEEA